MNSVQLVQQTEVYSITYNDVEYTLYVSGTDEWYNYELVDSDGNVVTDDELYEDLMDLYNDRD